jgi:HEAT repeat protein
MAAGYAEADSTRAKLLLVQALGGIHDPEAAGVLQALLGRDTSFSLRKEMVQALGQRKDDAAEQALAGLLASHEDAQLRFASAQALSGRASALPVLAECLLSDPSLNVRAELIHSVGLVRTTAARDDLAQMAQTAGDAALRKTAIQELARAFRPDALTVLGTLLNDSDEGTRKSALSAVARSKNDPASALHRAIPADVPATVRQ